MSIRLEFIDEFRITPLQEQQIRQILNVSFPNDDFTQSRTYLKQLPQRRLFAWSDNELIGHMGVEHRVIGLSTGPATIFGVIDLCIDSKYRGRGVASTMLNRLEQLGRENNVDFLVLFADDARLYLRNGFRHPGNRLRWLKIDEHETIGIGEEVVDALMVKEIAHHPWPNGLVDFLGYLF